MVRICAALIAVLLLGSCAGGTGGPVRGGTVLAADTQGGDSGESEPFDPPQTALEREISEDLRGEVPAAQRAAARNAAVRLAVEGDGAAEGTRDNEYIVVDAGGLRCRVRRKRSAGLEAVSCYGRLRISGGLVELHGGSFVPDLDGGLTAGGARSPYVFSSGFPLEEPRGITASTSFYGRTLVGAAVAARVGEARLAMLAGRERIERSGRPILTQRLWGGARIEVPVGSLHAGAWALGCSGEPRAPALGAGVRSPVRRGSFRVEWAWRRGGEPGALAAVALRSPSTRCGAIAYSLGAGTGGAFARIGGSELPEGSAHAGAAASIERRLPGRSACRFAVEWRTRSADDAERARTRLRAEMEKRWRRASLKLTCSLTEETRAPLSPFPSDGENTRGMTRSLGAVASISTPLGIDVRAAARNLADGSGGEGYLVASTMTLAGLFVGLRVSLFYSLYTASPGAPACSSYEPSLSSAYPWKYLAPGRSRAGVLIVNKFNHLEISCKVVWEDGGDLDWGGQGGCSF